MAVRVRFAPSPTGHLHIGGVRTALFNWLFARKHRGIFILRIEDTDEARSTVESVHTILEGLSWLGLDWDEGVFWTRDGWSEKGSHGPYFQMGRQETYRKHADQFLREGKAYRCYCTPEELEQMRHLAQLEKRPPKYDGRCRNLSAVRESELRAQGRKPVVRFKMPEEGAVRFKDLIHGEVSFENKLLDDFVMIKTSGIPTYNFACVMDDHFMEITHVIRGDDHLSNTPRQIHLYQALGWDVPEFAHLSMILGPDGSRLSKRHGATGVIEYKKSGYLPDAMANYLALLGWSTEDSQQLFAPIEMIEKFDISRCQKSPAIFDPQKLLWMNGEYIRKQSPRDLAKTALPWLKEAGYVRPETSEPDQALVYKVSLEQEKYKLLSDVPKLLDFFFQDIAYDPASVEKVLKKDGASGVLSDMKERLGTLEPFDAASLENLARVYAKEKNLKTGQVFHPLRVAVSGRTTGPSLFHMMEALGKEKVLSRIQKALGLLH